VGVATLLLALGVGVLIGHSNNPKLAQAPAPSQVIKIEGSLGGNTANSNTAAKAPTKAFTATKIPKLTQKVVKEVNSAASTVLGSSTGSLSNNPVQQVGGSCRGGAGCQGHKFTGNFFSGQ
jgi:hypothetical protein